MEKDKKLATSILRAELARRDLNFKDLHEKLKVIGIKDSYDNMRIKLSRGTFSFAYFLSCMEAIEARVLNLGSYFEDWRVQQAADKSSRNSTSDESKLHK